MPAETYSMIGLRIRTPHRHDVLSGRGGGINMHAGNKVFREWVAERKEEYNLAPNKMEKTRVALEVIDRVKQQNPPGRFLTRDLTTSSSVNWWVEVDEARALAKTSQALREGAPQIRLAHKAELMERASQPKRRTTSGKRKRKASSATTTTTTTRTAPSSVPSTRTFKRLPTDDYNQAMENLQANVREAQDLAEQQERQQPQQPAQSNIVAPLTSNKDFQQQYWDPNTKRLRFDHTAHVSPGTNNHDETQLLDAFSETPPLLSLPNPPTSESHVEELRLGSPAIMSPAASALKSLPRVHSLAFSDVSALDTNGVFDDDGEFVNPFEDESGIASKVMKSRQVGGNMSDHLRNLSSNEDINPAEPHHVEPYYHENDHHDRWVLSF